LEEACVVFEFAPSLLDNWVGPSTMIGVELSLELMFLGDKAAFRCN